MTASIPPIPQVLLSDGTAVPQLGFGLYRIPPDETTAVTAQALELGYRHLDSASIYRNESEAGAAILASRIPRDELFLTSKVWNDAQEPAAVRESLQRTLDALGTEYLDLFLIHWPAPRFDRYVRAWQTMLELRDEGLVRSVGVSNFLVAHLERLESETGVLPSVNQIELHPLLQQRDLTAFMNARGIALEAWGPLAQGSRALLDDPHLAALAGELGRDPAQIVLRWHLQLGHIIFPKSTRSERMLSNAQLFDFTLDGPQLEVVASLDRDLRVGQHPEEQH